MQVGQRVPTKVGDLEVRVVGDGDGRPTALLWHSLFVDSRSWGRVEADLAEDRRLILLTGPGHGRSTDPGRRYSMDECADAAIAVLDHLGIVGPVDWVGNAWGGGVGIIAAAGRPELCRSLVTAGTPIHSYTRAGRARTTLLLWLYRVLGPRRFIANAVVEALLSERTRSQDPAAVELVRDSFVNADRAGLDNAVVSISLGRADVTPLLPRVAAPTLFITGPEHSDWSPDQAEAANQLLPSGSVAVLDGTAYLGPLEAPEESARLVREHWAAHPPAAATAGSTLP